MSTTHARRPSRKDSPRLLLAIMLGPAALVLIVMIVYPICYSIWRSLFDSTGTTFVGLGNYVEMFQRPSTLNAVRNNLIWVLVAPLVCTVLGLIFAVLMEKIQWRTAFRLIIFMPMAISMLAAGVIWRSAFQQDPNIGLVNAVVVGIQDTFSGTSSYPGARPREEVGITQEDDGAIATDSLATAGDVVNFPLIGIKPDDVAGSSIAQPATSEATSITGTVWLDFVKGGGGEAGQMGADEQGLAGLKVEAVDASGQTIASTTTDDSGRFALEVESGVDASIVLPSTNFTASATGVNWLGPSLITPVVILAFIWIWAGFAMVMIASGLAAVDHTLIEAARTDGANEWQVFRNITIPQLLPVLSVVLVTLIINVLKIFDLVYVIPPGESKPAANVVAVQMWTEFGGNDYGMGSALAIFLLIMVLPFMLFNIRNFRKGRES